MNIIYQIATGTAKEDNQTEFFTPISEVESIVAIKSAFTEHAEDLGTYLTHSISKPDNSGKINITIFYTDFGNEWNIVWQLRPAL
jgi:hypothetical protein